MSNRILIHRHNRIAGFSLIELIVAVAVISILVIIVAVMISGARTRAHEIKTASQMRNLALVTLNFVNDNSGQFPRAIPSWDTQILRFIQGIGETEDPVYDPGLLHSPLDTIARANPRSFSYSAALCNWFGWDSRFSVHHGARLSIISDPANTVLYMMRFDTINIAGSSNHVIALSPGFINGKTLIAFCDGSVRPMMEDTFPEDRNEFYNQYLFIHNR